MPKHRCLKFLIQNEKDKEEILNKNVEDVNLFLITLRKINKNKLPKNHQKNIKNNIDFTNNTFCDENEIIKIFKEKKMIKQLCKNIH